MFIENAFVNQNYFWKYLLGSLMVIAATFAGQIPITVAMLFAAFKQKKPLTSLNTQALMGLLDKNLNLFLLLFSFVVGLLALFYVIKKLHQQTILEVTTSRKSIDWRRIFFSFIVWSIFSIVSVYASYLLMPQDFVLNFQLIPFLILFFIAVVFIPFQTSLEEYIFRGYLMQGFGLLAKNKWFPLIMTSIIFGTMHIVNPEVEKLGYIILVYYIATGLLLGMMTLMDDGMELALGFHAANNLVGCLLVTSDWSVLQTYSILKDISEPSLGLSIFVPVAVVYPLLLVVFAIKYKWSNWQEKLTGKINFVLPNKF